MNNIFKKILDYNPLNPLIEYIFDRFAGPIFENFNSSDLKIGKTLELHDLKLNA